MVVFCWFKTIVTTINTIKELWLMSGMLFFFSDQILDAFYLHKFKLGQTLCTVVSETYSETVKFPTKARICKIKLGDEDVVGHSI